MQTQKHTRELCSWTPLLRCWIENSIQSCLDSAVFASDICCGHYSIFCKNLTYHKKTHTNYTETKVQKKSHEAKSIKFIVVTYLTSVWLNVWQIDWNYVCPIYFITKLLNVADFLSFCKFYFRISRNVISRSAKIFQLRKWNIPGSDILWESHQNTVSYFYYLPFTQ